MWSWGGGDTQVLQHHLLAPGLVLQVFQRVLLLRVLEGAAVVRVGQSRHVDARELEDGGELLEAGSILHIQFADVAQTFRRQVGDARLRQVPRNSEPLA